MLVTVKLHGIFRIDRFKEKKAEYPPGTTVMDIVEQLKLPSTLLGIILVNDIHSTIDSQMKNGDTLVLLPILDGG
mgnify:CR=1 FL=1